MSSIIKCLPSIINKHQIFPDMKLHKMQASGWMPSNIEQVYLLEGKLRQLKTLSEKLNVFENLTAYNKFISHVEQSEKFKDDPDSLFIIIVDTKSKIININTFTPQNHKAAAQKYKEVVKYCAENDGCEVVMVSVLDINDLRSAYPAYFLDTKPFLNYLSRFYSK